VKYHSGLLKSMEWALMGGLLLILFAPLVGKIAGWPLEIDLKENRNLAHRPSIRNMTWTDLPRAIDTWWNDRFTFRTQIIPLRESLWIDMLNAPGKQYVRGVDGHIFLNPMPGEKFHGGQNPTVLDYLGYYRLTADQVSDWTDYLEGKNAWLQAHGIHYLFVISPNKITVEDRYLPNRIRMAKGKTYLDQLREQVFPKLTPQVDLLDLTPILTAKEQETGRPMFSRTDEVAHWNGEGFLEGLLAMDKHLRRHFPDMPPFPDTLLTLRKSDTDPTAFSCKWENDPTVQTIEETIFSSRTGDWTDAKCSKASGRKGMLTLFSDSSWKYFCGGLEFFMPGSHTAFPYQWEYHRHADIQHVTFDELRRSVMEEMPDVIVEAQTERALTIPPEIGIPEVFRMAARFAHGKTIFLWSAHQPDAIFEKNFDAIEIDRDACIVTTVSGHPVLMASHSIPVPDDSQTVIFMDMDAPAAGTLQVYWSIDDTFSKNDSITTDLEMGRNIVFLSIPLPAGKECRLQMVPGTDAGKYVFRKIELRATSS
jgi:hypothetical protein